MKGLGATVENPKMLVNARLRKRGFTLIELLVVVAIIALLISILLPALQKARDQGKNAVCRSNMHQLGVAVTQYLDDHKGRLPYILGTDQGSGKRNNWPFYQYHQLFNFWTYLKDRKIYVCPSARGENSVKIYDDIAAGNPYASYYTAFKSDDRYLKAYRESWWPDIKPTDYPGTKVTPVFTEYWSNDWSEGATSGGRIIPAINGGVIDRIPLPAYAIIMSDGVWETRNPRHSGGTQFVYLDGHVEWYPRQRYLDPQGAGGGYTPHDYDGFGNRPFFSWGLTREGFDALQGQGG